MQIHRRRWVNQVANCFSVQLADVALWEIKTLLQGGSIWCSTLKQRFQSSSLLHYIQWLYYVDCRGNRVCRIWFRSGNVVPCKIYSFAFVLHIDSSCFYTLILHSMLTSCHAKMRHYLIKVSVLAAESERKVCNGETLRRDLESKLVKKALLACQLTYTDGRCVKGISHTLIRGSPSVPQWEEMGLNESRKSGRRS